MGKDITTRRVREFVGKSLQGRFGAETGNVIFDTALELQSATVRVEAEIEKAIQASFEQILNYGIKIKQDVEAREDVRGKFA